jgi:peptide-methionine (S)-S-oxide reductase
MMAKQVATLGGGCFWCLEAVYLEVIGVDDVVSGYAGGQKVDPTYAQVCTGDTGHTEVVQVTFDDELISYREILDVFFSIHDPTTLNRQGADVGTQYRSAIFYHSDEQKQISETRIAELDQSGKWNRAIVTEVVPLEVFYPAEEYHQRYFQKNPYAGYCQAVVGPKVMKFKYEHGDMLKSEVSG